MKVKIQKIGRREVQTKYGMKPNMSIQASDGTWYSGWPSKETANWREGQTVDIDVTERTVDGPQGPRTFYNFTPHVISNDEVMSTLREILTLVKALNVGPGKKTKNSKGSKLDQTQGPYDDEAPPLDVDEQDVPPLEDEEVPF